MPERETVRKNNVIFLLGFMASGKTTLSTALKNRTGIAVIDLDDAIESKTGKSIPEIFAEYGQEEFRRIETETLNELSQTGGDLIIACGGGTPCHNGNMKLMAERGKTVRLDATAERIAERLAANRGDRPLLNGLSDSQLLGFIKKMMAEREEFYSQAQFCFDSNRLDTPEQIASTTKKFIQTFLPDYDRE